MPSRRIRPGFRRGFKDRQQLVEDLGTQAEENLEEHLVKRLERLASVKRFVLAWLGLLLLLVGGLIVQNLSLSSYFQTLGPVPGGIYREGILGRFTNANPMFATSDADAAVSRLIFAGLFTHDNSGKLIGDLASGYTSDDHGVTYTVKLRPGLKWQDGKPLTSADVVYTYQAIQNPDTQSPFLNSWRGINISAPDSSTVVFQLPGPLAAFPQHMTNGIAPKHLLEKVPLVDLRSADFNTVHPVGAGPFAWQAVEVTGNDPARAQQQIALTPFLEYQGGEPKLQKFIVRVFASKSELTNAFKTNQLNGVAGLSDATARKAHGVQAYNFLLRAANMVFFKTSSGIMAEQPVRQALVQSANVQQIINQLGYPTHAVRAPLLTGQLAYDPGLVQPGFDLKSAQKTLESNGWVVGKDGFRTKGSQTLSFTLTASNTPEYRRVAGLLQQHWQAAGFNVTTRFQDATDFQTTLNHHEYDAILDGISIGVDPDVFVYWDSSQADVRSANRLNLSEYNNSTADTALEAGRTRVDPSLRVIKYRPFLEAWQRDNPALGLYQPRLLYVTNGPVAGLTNQPISAPIDRFDNVHNWQIRQAKVTN